MKHVMTDLETLGKSAGCAMLSIGMVEFDPEKFLKGRTLHLIVNLQSCFDKGLSKDEETVQWWSKQSEEARVTLKKSESEKIGEDNVSLESALIMVNMFLKGCDPDVRMWSCGADFDLPILVAAFETCNKPVPWKFWNSRCFRTIKSLAPWVKAPKSGVFHNALDDANNQVDHLFEIAKNLRLKIR